MLYFLNLYHILNILKKKMTLITYVFPTLQTAKDVLKEISRMPRFRTPFNCQHVKGYRRIVKCVWQHFHHILSSLWRILSWKMTLVVIFEIVELFFNTLIDYDKSFLCNSENLSQPINNNYLKTIKRFLNFLQHFFNQYHFLNILQKRWHS